MQRYIAFLRGINLGKRRLPMSQLRELFAELRFNKVETFIASGNVIFTTATRNTSKLEAEIARHLEARLGYRVDTFIRTMEEVAAISRAKIFLQDGRDTVHVGYLHQTLAPEIGRRLAAIRTAEDEFRVIGREYYWLCRIRTSDSKIWRLPVVKALRLPTSTMRNMTSIRKLVAKHGNAVNPQR